MLLLSYLFTERMFLSGEMLERVDRERLGICCYYWFCSDMFFLIYKALNFLVCPKPDDIYRYFITKLGSGKF